MTLLLKDESAFLRWRRLVIAGDESQLVEPRAILDRARIPHVVGLHYPYRTPTGKPCEAEPWIMVPFQNYGAACSLVFSLSSTQSHTASSDVQVTVSSDKRFSTKPEHASCVRQGFACFQDAVNT
jgi:hypothetical protein